MPRLSSEAHGSQAQFLPLVADSVGDLSTNCRGLLEAEPRAEFQAPWHSGSEWIVCIRLTSTPRALFEVRPIYESWAASFTILNVDHQRDPTIRLFSHFLDTRHAIRPAALVRHPRTQ